MAANLTIELVSDFVCPYCYLGKRRLDAALKQRPDLAVALQWQPFQLSPDMPREGRNRHEHYAQIFGAERAESIMRNMQHMGAEEGITFGSSPDAMSPNTLSAHVLMHWAQSDEQVDQDLLAEKLFAAHHVDCEDIGSQAVLARIASETGMDADRVAGHLASGIDEEAVQTQIAESAARGVSGVPFFIVNGRYAISGAQPAEVLLDALDKIAAEAA